MLIDPRWELKWLGEEAMSVLVETPDGEVGKMPRERLTNYMRVDNNDCQCKRQRHCCFECNALILSLIHI